MAGERQWQWQWQRIVALAQEGVERADIAHAVGCPVQQVHVVISQRRRMGYDIPYKPPGVCNCFTRNIPTEIRLRIEAEAKAQKCRVSTLCSEILIREFS